MTFGQMKILTDRLNNIKKMKFEIKNEQLASLLADVYRSFKSDDIYAKQLRLAIVDELGMN